MTVAREASSRWMTRRRPGPSRSELAILGPTRLIMNPTISWVLKIGDLKEIGKEPPERWCGRMGGERKKCHVPPHPLTRGGGVKE